MLHCCAIIIFSWIHFFQISRSHQCVYKSNFAKNYITNLFLWKYKIQFLIMFIHEKLIISLSIWAYQKVYMSSNPTNQTKMSHFYHNHCLIYKVKSSIYTWCWFMISLEMLFSFFVHQQNVRHNFKISRC